MEKENIGVKNRLLPMLITVKGNIVGKEPIMLTIPSAAEQLFLQFSITFTQPTFQRILPLAIGAILTMGQRTVTGILWTMRGLIKGHPSTYHRVFSRAVWSLWPLGRILATAILGFIPHDEPVLVPMDDTTAQHRGKHVYGKGCYHDAVRSAHKHVVFRWGHRWVVLAISVKFPFTSKRWALPVLVALYRPRELNQAEGRRHKTASQIARELMAVLIHWFPQRKFVFLGDGGYASHELAKFCYGHRQHTTLVSRFRPDANLYTPPPEQKGRAGRPRIKGRKLPKPKEVVAHSKRTTATVDWYGGSQRLVELVSGTGLWYHAAGGQGLVPVRWVFVHDIQGTHRDEYIYTTETSLSPEQMVSWFTARWPIETTFQEVRAHLGFETPRQYVAKSVLRTAPCLLGLFSVVCLIFAEHTRCHRIRVRQTKWYVKTEPTFSDVIATVRRLFWQEAVFEKSSFHKDFKKLSPKLKNLLLDYLSQAA
ncbi:MAG: transposase [Phycisphaerae bacterium]|nr:transposase [Phycisphaerae bacterium]NIW94398.1 transposase [Phycisphaerae bacterium]